VGVASQDELIFVLSLKFVTVRRDGLRTITYFPSDHVVCEAIAPDTPWHRQIMEWVGRAGDPGQYNFEHEFIHSFLSEKMWDGESYVVGSAARDRKISVVGAKFEERWCYHFHRFLNDVAGPLEPEWPEWRKEARSLLGRET
jgi:hypothetical protein